MESRLGGVLRVSVHMCMGSFDIMVHSALVKLGTQTTAILDDVIQNGIKYSKGSRMSGK